MASIYCGIQPAKSDGRLTQRVVDGSDNWLTLLDLYGAIGGTRSPELWGSWTFDNQLKMFTTICHFSSEIFKIPIFARIEVSELCAESVPS